jgi:tryptophan aminotransferase
MLKLCLLTEVNADTQGLSPGHLKQILENWETDRPGQKRPKVLYTIPMGSNPTGASIPESRKIEM